MGMRYSCDFCGEDFDHHGGITRARLFTSVGSYQGDEWETQGGSAEGVDATWLFCHDCRDNAFTALSRAACPTLPIATAKPVDLAEAPAEAAPPAETAELAPVIPDGPRYLTRDGRVTDGPVTYIGGNAPWLIGGGLGGRWQSWTRHGFRFGPDKPDGADLVCPVDEAAEG